MINYFNVKFYFENDTEKNPEITISWYVTWHEFIATRAAIQMQGLHTLIKQFRASQLCLFIKGAPFMRTPHLVFKHTRAID